MTFQSSNIKSVGRMCSKIAIATLDLEERVLSLLLLASAEICWQLDVDMGVAALPEVGCLPLGCLSQSGKCLQWRDDTCMHDGVKRAGQLLFVIMPLKWSGGRNGWKETEDLWFTCNWHSAAHYTDTGSLSNYIFYSVQIYIHFLAATVQLYVGYLTLL